MALASEGGNRVAVVAKRKYATQRKSRCLSVLGKVHWDCMLFGQSLINATMSRRETALYRRLVRDSSGIVEFGCGRSTLLALRHSRTRIYSVESDRDWIERLLNRRRVRRAVESRRLCFHHSDLGPVSEWGWPVNPLLAKQTVTYYSAIWSRVNNGTIDLVLVDGRFRVACAIEALRHCPDATIVIHDFWNRPHYHDVLPALLCTDRVDTLGIFVARAYLKPEFLDQLFLKSQFDPR